MRLIYCLTVLFFIGCSVDELPPCEGDGVPGEICKEYQYVYGRYNGVNDYSYDLETNKLLNVVTLKKNGQEEGTTVYSYNEEGRVRKVEKFNPAGALISSEENVFNASGQLLTNTLTSDKVFETNYVYEDDVQIAERFAVDGGVEWVDSLEYYTGTTDLYRRLRYVDAELSEIKILVEYSNGITEETTTNQNAIIQQKVVRSYDGELLLEELIYSAGGTLTQRELREYSEGELLLITKFDVTGEEFERLEYYRF